MTGDVNQDELRPWLSVVVPAYNEEKRLERGLSSILAYLVSRDSDAEMIVVDGVGLQQFVHDAALGYVEFEKSILGQAFDFDQPVV